MEVRLLCLLLSKLMSLRKNKKEVRFKKATNLGYIVPKITRKVFRHHSFAAADMMLHWQDIVGQQIAQYTVPHRFSNGILTISCPSVIAVELHYRKNIIIARINTWYGKSLVKQMKFIHNSLAAKTKRPKDRPSAQNAPRKICHLAHVQDEELRHILERIGSHVLNGD